MEPRAPGVAQWRLAVAGFIAAIVVLIGGIAAALTKDDNDNKSSTGASAASASSTSTTTASSSASSSSSAASTTTTTAASTTTVPGSTTTTARASTSASSAPAALTESDAERVSNGLFSAYRAGDKTAASQFATTEVVNGLFAVPFHEAQFQGCTADGRFFICRFANSTSGATYDFTVQAAPHTGTPLVVVFEYQGPSDTTTTSTTTTSTTTTTIAVNLG
jgi:hypothetical protein